MEALTTRLSRIIQSVKTVGEQQVATVRISLGTREGNEEVVENWKMFLDIVVKRVEETIDFELSEDTSDILNLEFVGKCEGRYSVSVNMYGVGVKGSPMEVEIRGSNAIIEKIVVVEVETENLKDINTLEGEAVVGDEEIIRQNSLDHETEVVNVPGEAFVEDVSVIEEGNMDYNLDEETIANNNVDSVEELIAEEAVLMKEVVSEVVEEKLDEFPPQSLPAIYSVGSSCLVRWCEDSVWYRARVDRIDEGLYEVTFLDYGNKVVVGLDNMVATVADIPSDEMEKVDYMVNVASPDRVEETLGRRKRRSVTVTSRLKPRKSRRLRSTNGEENMPMPIPTDEENCKFSDDLADSVRTLCQIFDASVTLTGMRFHTLNMHKLRISKYKELHGPFKIIEQGCGGPG